MGGMSALCFLEAWTGTHFEVGQDTELNLLLISRDREKGPAGDLLILNLQTAQSRVEMCAPVHQAIRPVDKALVVELAESLHGRRAEVLIHCESLAAPVHGATHQSLGVVDLLVVLVLPLPHEAGELLASEINASLLLLLPPAYWGQLLSGPNTWDRLQHLLDNRLGRDSGMIASGDPKGLEAPHAVPPDKGVLERVGLALVLAEVSVMDQAQRPTRAWPQ